MKSFKKAMLAVCMFAAAGMASATAFTVSGSTYVAGSGYGVDASENTNVATLLDVVFSNTGFTTQNFNLVTANDFSEFTVGRVNFRESNNLQGIVTAERDNLNVSWSLNFTAPGAVTNTVQANGVAVIGSVQDSDIDYTLTWDPIFVNFGASGQYRIDLFELAFSRVTAQDLVARVTLVNADVPVDVPEPASLGLLAIGLLGAGFLRRRNSK